MTAPKPRKKTAKKKTAKKKVTRKATRKAPRKRKDNKTKKNKKEDKKVTEAAVQREIASAQGDAEGAVKSAAGHNLVAAVSKLVSSVNAGNTSAAIIISISPESSLKDCVSFAGNVPADRAAYLLRLAEAYNINRVLRGS